MPTCLGNPDKLFKIGDGELTFVVIIIARDRDVFYLDKFVPFVASLPIQQALWNPGKEVCGADRLLTGHDDRGRAFQS